MSPGEDLFILGTITKISDPRKEVKNKVDQTVFYWKEFQRNSFQLSWITKGFSTLLYEITAALGGKGARIIVGTERCN